MVRIGNSVRKLREGRFWTQEKLAGEAGMSQKQISQIERNQVEPRFSTVTKLAEVLGVEPTDLVDDAQP